VPLTLTIVGGAILISYLRGGRLSRIANSDLRMSWLLFAGLFLQLGVDLAATRVGFGGAGAYGVLLASQVFVLGWVLANWWRPGMVLIGLGLLMNAVVIGANGAMPVDRGAIQSLDIGDDVEVHPGKHVEADDDTRLRWLADVYPLPPIRTIVSLGDMVLAAGLVPLVHHLMTYRTPAERRGGSRSRPRRSETARRDDESEQRAGTVS
jgi:hypothetical protein